MQRSEAGSEICGGGSGEEAGFAQPLATMRRLSTAPSYDENVRREQQTDVEIMCNC
jgi:hypothetical protein